MNSLVVRALLALTLCASTAVAWVTAPAATLQRSTATAAQGRLYASVAETGNLHGQGSCFLPLKQLIEDDYAPRIIQIAGAYPGLTKEELFAVTSEPPPDQGQWTYDFSDPEGPQLGTVALEGSAIVMYCEDPVAVIAEHTSLGVELPKELESAVDLIVLVDRAKKAFAERKFLVIDTPGVGVQIQAFGVKSDIPEGSEILGQVDMVQIPWLPSMKPSKSGFMEADELY